MCPSAISTPTFQAKISNIQNAADTSFVYSGGAWTFKNSAAATTFSVSDAGAVTVGPAISAGVNGVKFVVNTGDQGSTWTAATADHGKIQLGNVGGATTAMPIIWGTSNDSTTGTGLWLMAATNDGNTYGDMIFDVRENDNTAFATPANKAYDFSVYGTSIMNATRAGAWTFPVSTNTPRMLANTIQTKTASGTFIFANANDTNVGSYANDGIWLFPFNYAATGGTQAAAYMSSTGRLGLVNPSRASSKTNIVTIENVLDKVEKVRGLVSFDYIDEELPKDQLGLIADDFLKDFPSVCVFLDGKLHSIDYGKVSAIALSGVKELSSLVKQQQAMIEQANLAIETLQAKVAALESK
jgi:hypothetical protein